MRLRLRLKEGRGGLKGLGGQVLKPELDAAVFGGEGVTFSLRASAFLFFSVFVARCRNLSRML